MQETGLRPELLEKLPLFTDGVILWDVFQKYVTTFLQLFYKDDDEIMADEELKQFWASFTAGDFGPTWDLPKLTFDSLVALVTDLIWWVTGAHSFVGAIVEYLVNPSGIMPKIMDGKDVPDVQSYALALIIISFTGIPQPALLSDWTHLFKGVRTWRCDRRTVPGD